MLESLIEITRRMIDSYGLAGVFAVSLLESFIFPVPTAIIITSATALGMNVWAIVTVATIGSVIGAVIGHSIGKKGGRPALLWIFNEKKIKKVDNFFDKYGIWAVGIAALSPIPYKVFTISAGVAGMKVLHLIAISIPARFLQFLIFAEFGNILGGLLL